MRRLLACTLVPVAFGCAPPAPEAAPSPAPTATAADRLPPLIDRETFFDDPEIASGQISPDGRFISFRRPLDGVMNIWVKERGQEFDEARPITDDRERPVPGYFWSPDARYILYVQDRRGDENFRVYAVDPTAAPRAGERVPPARDLTPLENVRAVIISVPEDDPGRILVGLNDRDPRLHDVYRVDVRTGERALVFRNDENIAQWTADLEGDLRLGTRQLPDGSWEILRVDGNELTPVYSCAWDEECAPMRFHPDGRRVYLRTNRGTDLSRLALFDPQTRQEEQVESDPEGEVDFGSAQFSRATRELVATLYIGDRLRLYPQTAEFRRDYERVRAALPDGDVFFGSQTRDDRLQLVSVASDVDPGATYLYDRGTGEIALLYRPRPNLPSEHLARMEPIRYTARDGLEIPAYLTLPSGVEARDLPLVVVPHGGPWARNVWGYDAWAQFLANRGYAVLEPNFRGSTGFGKEFLNLGNAEWGTGAMQHDLTDGVRHLIDVGIADPDRVGIMGFSYGGYATLAGLAFTPELYAAGVSMVGPSNIITLLRSIPPYWEPLRLLFTQRVGDPEDPADRERLVAQSPLFSAANIRAPLLVYQGANDPRVVKHESDQIVVAMRELGRPVEYLVAWDEGHSMAVRENRLAIMAAVEQFLAEHLGGRYQESVPPEIRNRLADLTADVDTLRLPAEEEAAAGGPSEASRGAEGTRPTASGGAQPLPAGTRGARHGSTRYVAAAGSEAWPVGCRAARRPAALARAGSSASRPAPVHR